MSYSVFTRNWWKPNSDWPDGLEPDGGAPRHYIERSIPTEGEAREICLDWNAEHPPGRLSRKAEFEEN